MTTFYLVRHGSCDALAEMLWGHRPGIHLNETGRLEALRLAERFSKVNLDAIYSSPLERTRETADPIARAAKLDVQENTAFNEIDFGHWAGQSFDTLARDDHWRRFNTKRSTTRIPGGELFLNVQVRTIAELERLSEQHVGQRVAIVSHADVIKAMVGYIIGAPIDLFQRIEISPCSVSIVATGEEDLRLLAVNCRGELT